MAISQFFFILIFLSISNLLLLPHKTFSFSIDDALESLPKLPKSTVHDLLTQFGFPKGLLPDAVKSYSPSNNGELEVELECWCYVHFDDFVYYDEKINGKLKYGVIFYVSGIQAKKLFIWIPISRIEIDSKDGFIEFHLRFVSEKLPVQHFGRIPTCQSKACGGRDDVDDVVVLSEKWPHLAFDFCR